MDEEPLKRRIWKDRRYVQVGTWWVQDPDGFTYPFVDHATAVHAAHRCHASLGASGYVTALLSRGARPTGGA